MSDPHPINQTKAIWARKAVEAYAPIVGADLYKEAVSYLIGDLGHLCDEEGLDYIAILSQAISWWYIQRVDPDRLTDPPKVRIFVELSGGSS